MRRLRKAVFILATAVLAGAAPAHAFDGWHLESAVVLPSGTAVFDYLTYDAGTQRLLLGHRKEGLQVFDVASGRIVAAIAGTPAASSNGAVLVPEFDLGLSGNENGTLTPFRLSTLEAQPAIRLGDELDASHYDPLTKRIFVNMGADKDGTDIVVLQAPELNRVGVVKVPTRKAEHAEADGLGNLFLAARDTEMVYRIDTRALTVTASWPTVGCGQTNSLAVDRANRRVLLGCRGNEKVKPSFAAMDADTGAVVATLEIGAGNDGLIYDPELKRIFLANGLNAVLNVIEQVDADHYRPVEALGTRAMVKVLAYDSKAKKLYSMTAEGTADFGKKILTAVGPFYPNTFLPNTFTVLTYSR